MNEIFIFAELNNNFELMPFVFELSNEAQKLKSKLDNSKISAVIINKDADYKDIIDTLSMNGFDKVYIIKNYIYENYSTAYYTNAICELIKEKAPKIVLFGATRLGRDLAPRISARLSIGLTADSTELDIDKNSNLLATRPTFGGNLMATICSKTFPQMATVRPNVFTPINPSDRKQIEVEEKSYDLSSIRDFVEIIKETNFKNNQNNLSDAKIIVAGGKGLKNKEGFELLKKFADLIGAEVGASRGAVEKGLAEQHQQIGQTGKTVTPKLYIACGISGAIQHIMGMNSSQTVIAINSDKNAQIFNYSDYGIVGDIFEILKNLIKELGDK